VTRSGDIVTLVRVLLGVADVQVPADAGDVERRVPVRKPPVLNAPALLTRWNFELKISTRPLWKLAANNRLPAIARPLYTAFRTVTPR